MMGGIENGCDHSDGSVGDRCARLEDQLGDEKKWESILRKT